MLPEIGSEAIQIATRPTQEATSIRGTLSPRSFQDRRARFIRHGTAIPAARHLARKKHRPYTHGLVLISVSLAVVYALVTGAALHTRTAAFASPITGLSMPAAGTTSADQGASVLRPREINTTAHSEQATPPEHQEVARQLADLGATPTPEPTPSPEPVVQAASVPTPDLPPYQVYTVADGDTVSTIAAKFGIGSEYVVANNAEIQDANSLVPGQSLLIPAGNGILHEVKLGETLSDIATAYEVDVATIAAFPANHITEANNITETELIYVPGATIPAPAAAPLVSAPPTPEVAPTPEPPPVPADGGDGEPTAPAESTPGGDEQGDPSGVAPGETTPSSGKGLIWPVVGPISSCYCAWHPLGIDIDGYALEGAAVLAATDGTVTFAGGNACCSYGLYVIVMSPDGIETLYAHLSSLSVEQGQTVAQGDALGIIGRTGYATGTHLHFEVIDNGVRQNPLDYLPGQAACEPGQCE